MLLKIKNISLIFAFFLCVQLSVLPMEQTEETLEKRISSLRKEISFKEQRVNNLPPIQRPEERKQIKDMRTNLSHLKKQLQNFSKPISASSPIITKEDVLPQGAHNIEHMIETINEHLSDSKVLLAEIVAETLDKTLMLEEDAQKAINLQAVTCLTSPQDIGSSPHFPINPRPKMYDAKKEATNLPHPRITQYITEPSDERRSRKDITLAPVSSTERLFIGDSAYLNFNSRISFPILRPDDHLYHYITALINQKVFQETRACHINYLLLGLDVIYETSDSQGEPIFQRKTSPLLYDRSSGLISITPNENTEICTFLSFSYNYQSDHRKIIALSQNHPWEIIHDSKPYKIYFHPSNMAKDQTEKQYMSQQFPKQRKNFDSEINSVYTLLQNPHLITQFLETLPQSKVVSLGLRYYSFLDMCGRCQRFLEENQSILKPSFIEALKTFPHLQVEGDGVPFFAVAHGNRIYGVNEYSTEAKISLKGYPYATSGSSTGTFVRQLPKYVGGICPLSTGTNRLVSFIHEPDLGDTDEYGIVRHYFSHLKDVIFSQQGFSDQHAPTLSGKLKRANPHLIDTIDISHNFFGIVEPDFWDDPIELTGGKDLKEIFDFISHCTALQTLRVSGNHLTESYSFSALSKTLPILTHLRVLDVSGIGGGESAGSLHIKNLLEYFPYFPVLEYLNLNHNFIYVEGVEVLIDVLSKLPNLEWLGLAYGALCHRDGREDYDDDYIDSLNYAPEILNELSNTIINHEKISFIDMRHYKEQIEEDDINNFIINVQKYKPYADIKSESKKFKRKGYIEVDGDFY